MSRKSSYLDDPYRRPTQSEAAAFWEQLLKKGLPGLALYFLSMVLFLLVFWWLASGLVSKYFGIDPWLLLLLALIPLTMLFFYIPSIPRSYKFLFKGKMRPEITGEVLDGLLVDLTRKSLVLAALVVIVLSVVCVLVYAGAQYFALSDTLMVTMEVAAAFNVILISLMAISHADYSNSFLRKALTELDYMRYTNLTGYWRVITLLLAFDALIVIFILYSLSARLTVELAIIMLIALVDNVILVAGVWNYLKMKGERFEPGRYMWVSLAMLALVDVILVASLAVQKMMASVNYEKTVLMLLAAFILGGSLLQLLWLVSAPARRLLKPKKQT